MGEMTKTLPPLSLPTINAKTPTTPCHLLSLLSLPRRLPSYSSSSSSPLPTLPLPPGGTAFIIQLIQLNSFSAALLMIIMVMHGQVFFKNNQIRKKKETCFGLLLDSSAKEKPIYVYTKQRHTHIQVLEMNIKF